MGAGPPPTSARQLRVPVAPSQPVASHANPESDASPSESHSDPRPLQGVCFSAESAPGPSGRRPEHLRDILACPRKRVTRRLLLLLDRLEREADAGCMPESMRWILSRNPDHSGWASCYGASFRRSTFRDANQQLLSACSGVASSACPCQVAASA